MVHALLLFVPVSMLAGAALAIPQTDPAQVEQDQQFNLAVDEMISEMMRPGPKRQGWDEGGVDIYQVIAAAPGGAKGNLLLRVDNQGLRSVGIVEAGAVESHVPKDWRFVRRAGSLPYKAGMVLSISELDGSFQVAAWEGERRVGSAFCSEGGIGAALYRSPSPTTSEEMPPDTVPAYFDQWIRRIEAHTLCWRYDRDGESANRFRLSYFLEDGRSLPAFDALEDRVTIVPAVPIDQLIRAAAEGD